MVEPSAFSRRRLEAIAEAALARAGVVGVLPTPLAALHPVAGIDERLDMAALPLGLAAPGRALLGALWFEGRALFVDPAQSEPRRRFTEAHEIMHGLCPWHRAVLIEAARVGSPAAASALSLRRAGRRRRRFAVHGPLQPAHVRGARRRPAPRPPGRALRLSAGLSAGPSPTPCAAARRRARTPSAP